MAEQTLSLDSSTDDAPLQAISQKPAGFVRASLQKLSEMTDSSVQAYINYCAECGLAAHRRWEQTGNFADAGERDACWDAEADALIELGSRPGAVARIKVEGALG